MEIKDKQINLRVSKNEREKIKIIAKQNNYESVTDYIVSAALNKLKIKQKNKERAYTLTLNPSVDYIIKTKNSLNEITNFNPNDKVYEAGGKGINASIIMNEFGYDNLAIHYSGGFSGDLITEQLSEKGVNNVQIKSLDDTRINLKLNFADKNYEINSTAMPLSNVAKNKIIKEFVNFNKNDTLLIMGSFHPTDDDFIIEISSLAFSKGINIVYDLSKPLLKKLLKYKPLFIKPNKEELEVIFDAEIKSDKEIIYYMKKLKDLGAKNVAITMGKDGSYLLDENDTMYHAKIDPIELVSPQGSGDSFISTFMVKYNEGSESAFKWANAAGAATAQVKGLAEYSLIEKTLNKVNLKEIKN